MASIFDCLRRRKLLKKGEYPFFLENSVCYETIMGSIAYATNVDTSDFDIYGVCIPPKNTIFPHLEGHILGFGKSPPKFENWQRHHIQDPDAGGGKGRSYDLNFYSIIHYFQLCMDCNPNMIDSLFTPRRCVLYTNSIGELIRENRKLFLHKGAWHRFKGFSYSQMHKMQSMDRTSKRAEIVKEFGYDVKFASHTVRLMNEIEQILVEGDLDLERNSEQLRSIRRGEWTIQQIKTYFNDKEKQLEELYLKSELPKFPNEDKIKKVLLQCLEIFYGDIDQIVRVEDEATQIVKEIMSVLQKHNFPK